VLICLYKSIKWFERCFMLVDETAICPTAADPNQSHVRKTNGDKARAQVAN